MRKPPNWRGQTVVCIASGPSLTPEDCAAVRAAGVPAIVTNTTFRLCPWADMLVGFDSLWWRQYVAEVRATFAGRMYCHAGPGAFRGVEWPGLLPGYRPFGNSGAMAAVMAIVCGSRDVVLLGYDCQATGGRVHHHDDHPAPLRNADTMPKWPRQFERLAVYARAKGASVRNATPGTALEAFPRIALQDAIPDLQAAA